MIDPAAVRDVRPTFIDGPRADLVDAVAERSVEVEPPPGPDRLAKGRKRGRTAESLTIWSDARATPWVKLFAKLDAGRLGQQATAHSPQQLSRILRRYRRIERLHLAFHGTASGDLAFGRNHLDELQHEVNGAVMRAALEPFEGSVGTVEFINCRIGFRPDLLVGFGRLVKADRLIAHTSWGLFASTELVLGDRAASEEWVRRTHGVLAPFLDRRNPTLDQILAMRGRNRSKIALLMRAGVIGLEPEPAEVAHFHPPPPGEAIVAPEGTFAPSSRPFGDLIIPMAEEELHSYRAADGVPDEIEFREKLHCRIEIDLRAPTAPTGPKTKP